eukprot:8657935-Pyramimonas_sp.AAC.1
MATAVLRAWPDDFLFRGFHGSGVQPLALELLAALGHGSVQLGVRRRAAALQRRLRVLRRR